MIGSLERTQEEDFVGGYLLKTITRSSSFFAKFTNNIMRGRSSSLSFIEIIFQRCLFYFFGKRRGEMMKAKLFLRRNSPIILSIIASAGVISTAILAGKATPKVVKKLEDAKQKKGEDLTKFEIVKAAAPLYLPSILCGSTTVFCIISANALNKKKQTSLASAYALIDRSYKDYRNKVIETIGEEKEAEIRAMVIDDKVDRSGNLVCHDEEGLSVFYLPYADAYFKSSYAFVVEACYHFNRNFILRGYAELNEFLEMLGLEAHENLWGLGWSTYAQEEYGYAWVDVTVRRLSKGNYYTIDFPFEPHPDLI